FAHRARLRRTLGPAEALGGVVVALAQLLARPGLAAARIGFGVIPEAQLQRIDAKRVGELVHRRLEREGAARLARRALESRRGEVELREAMARGYVRAGVKRARGHRGRLGEVLDERSMRNDVVPDRDQLGAFLRAERDSLLGARTAAD